MRHVAERSIAPFRRADEHDPNLSRINIAGHLSALQREADRLQLQLADVSTSMPPIHFVFGMI